MAGDLFDSTIGKNWSLNRGDEPFPDPFMDYASTVMPENIRDALRFCEFIFHTNSMVREAARRIISYFITDIDIQGVNGDKLGDDEKQKYLTFLNDTLKIKNILHSAGLDFLCYGNSFSSLVLPFRRYLSCPKCYFDVPLTEVMKNPVFGFQWKMPEFVAKCPNPNCGHQGKWNRIDRRLTDESQVTVKRWSPYEMEIRQDLITDRRDYIWRIPEDYRLQIRRGDPQVLPVVPWEVVEAVQSNGYLLFDKEVVFHMSEPTLAGVRSRGWGISRTLVNFRQAWYCQVLHRYNEAIALDYVVPFRVLTPSATSSSNPEAGDPLMNLDMGGLGSEVKAMLRKRRRDPAAWNFLSHPIDYKMLGGEANQLAPTELLNQGITTLLNGFGMPAELYNGTLSLQAVLPAIRLFQSSWTYLVHYLNDFLTFVVKRTADGMGWEPATAKLLMPTMTDDMNNVMAKLQLMQAQQITRAPLFAAWVSISKKRLVKSWTRKDSNRKSKQRSKKRWTRLPSWIRWRLLLSKALLERLWIQTQLPKEARLLKAANLREPQAWLHKVCSWLCLLDLIRRLPHSNYKLTQRLWLLSFLAFQKHSASPK
jgi:hypothetical protein